MYPMPEVFISGLSQEEIAFIAGFLANLPGFLEKIDEVLRSCWVLYNSTATLRSLITTKKMLILQKSMLPHIFLTPIQFKKYQTEYETALHSIIRGLSKVFQNAKAEPKLPNAIQRTGASTGLCSVGTASTRPPSDLDLNASLGAAPTSRINPQPNDLSAPKKVRKQGKPASTNKQRKPYSRKPAKKPISEVQNVAPVPELGSSRDGGIKNNPTSATSPRGTKRESASYTSKETASKRRNLKAAQRFLE